jgi:hypothetical protein
MKGGNGIRPYCGECTSYYDYTLEGAIERWVAENDGQNPPVKIKKDPDTYSTLEVAVLFQISTGGVRTLANPKKTKPNLVKVKGLSTQMLRFSPKVVHNYQRDHQDLIERERSNAKEKYAKIVTPPNPIIAAPQLPLIAKFMQQPLPSKPMDSGEADDVILDLVVSIKAFFISCSLGAGVSVDEFIEFAASPLMANAVKRADKYLKEKSDSGEEVSA